MNNKWNKVNNMQFNDKTIDIQNAYICPKQP